MKDYKFKTYAKKRYMFNLFDFRSDFYYTFIIAYYSDDRSASTIDNKKCEEYEEERREKNGNQIK